MNVRPSALLILSLAVLSLSGCTEEDLTSPTQKPEPASETAVALAAASASAVALAAAACDHRADMVNADTCVQYTAEQVTKGEKWINSQCQPPARRINGECPKEQALGTCRNEGGALWTYYAGATNNYTGASAAKDCKLNLDGTWQTISAE